VIHEFRRTLIRVVEVSGAGMSLVIPAWNPNEEVKLPWKKVQIRYLQAGDRFHAYVNIGVEDKSQLVLDTWEV
jgi:hypothetical protein